MTNARPTARPKTLRNRVVDTLRERDRLAGKYDRTRRLRDVIGDTHGQRDWGHRLMALVGRNDTGSWSPPRARDLYIRVGWERREDRTAIEGTQNEQVETTHAMTAWDGVKRGEEWRTFDWQDDGHTLRIGWLGDDGRIHDSGLGAVSGEVARFRRWFIWDSWIKAQWCGLRPWLYYKGLHAAVHRKVRFGCHVTPPRGTGGYSHWYCTVPLSWWQWARRVAGYSPQHEGPHRYVNYTWVEAGHVSYDEAVAVAR